MEEVVEVGLKRWSLSKWLQAAPRAGRLPRWLNLPLPDRRLSGVAAHRPREAIRRKGPPPLVRATI